MTTSSYAPDQALPGCSGAKPFPSKGRAPSISKIAGEMAAARASHVSLSVVNSIVRSPNIASDVSVRLRSRRSMNVPGETAPRSMPWSGFASHTRTSRSGSAYGRRAMTTAWTTANTAVFAPMPRLSAVTALSVKPGALRRPRTAWRRSCARSSSHPMLRTSRTSSVNRSTPPNARTAARRAEAGSIPSRTFFSVSMSRWNASSRDIWSFADRRWSRSRRRLLQPRARSIGVTWGDTVTSLRG